MLEASALPEYEQRLDHAGLMADWSEEFYHKGMVTYRTTCYACHGDTEQPGSIPNSRQFWQEAFKNGADPYAMYQTLTRGYGLMPPQVRLTPREKYEVIHFIREEFLKAHNPDQYFEVTDDWLASLPKGDTLGPDPQPYQPWAEMDYGPFLIHTYELANSGDPPRGISGGRSPLPNEDFRDVNFAYKGIAMRLDAGEGGVAAGNAFALFDHDLLRLTGFWTGEGFIDYEGILLNDRHNIFPRTVGTIQVENSITPGWANPATGSFEDPRFVAVDGRSFGPLPKDWAHYQGLYRHGDRIVIAYTVGDAEVLETYDLEAKAPTPVLSRTLNLTASSTPLTLRIAPSDVAVHVVGDGVTQAEEEDFHVLKVPAGTATRAKIWMANSGTAGLAQRARAGTPPKDLQQYTQGGPPQYTEVLSTPIISGDDADAYAVDVLTLPQENPWNSRMRPTGIDFLEGGDEAVVSTVDGEVWRLEGLTQSEGAIRWHRIATGLFQPLGIKYHDGAIYVGCRDQIVVLRDLNGDGETDFYESFNSDHQVTEHFHEFAMGLQTDDAGNFYYAKSARHARTALVPQHGTLIRVSPDGSTSEIIANGFRAANGVLLNPDGSFIVTDQEGHWNPMNRINWVEEGGFYGNMYGYGAPADSSDTAMMAPLLWIDQKHDRSPAELLWADSERWGPLDGSLLSLSYGYGKIFVVMPQFFGDTKQAGMVELPVPQFPTGIMRGRFNPKDGQLYALGMSAWATNQMIQVGGLYRVRYTGQPLHLPVAMKALASGIELTFAEPLDRAIAEDPNAYTITTWDLKRTRNYGSKRYNTEELSIDGITLSDDGETVLLQLDVQPTWIMEIQYELESADGTVFNGVVQSTVYQPEATLASR
ncbi:MAG: c-type cytochrome [Rhodothermales bacterium]